MLESTSVLQRYGSLELALVAWRHAMTHTADEPWMRSDVLCYEFLTGRLDVNVLVADRERNARAIHWYIVKATKRLESKRPLILDSGDIGMAEGLDYFGVAR